MLRPIDQIYRGAPEHMVGDGFRVSNYFPSATERMKRMSPFFLLDYHPPLSYTPTQKRRGVGTHPHRGFETVTIAFQGDVEHKDSAGNGGVIRPGDVQWMTAGGGVLHNEYHGKEFSEQGGVMQMAQIWVNLPKKDKLTPAKYQSITTHDIPEVLLPKDGGKLRVISGSFGDAKGPAFTFTPANMFDIRLKAGGRMTIPIPRHFNAGLLILDGEVTVNDNYKVTERDFVLFKNEGETITLEARTNAKVMVLNGEPIEEPLYHYGPFVMNTPDEINQAIVDYNNGKFGHLSDEE